MNLSGVCTCQCIAPLHGRQQLALQAFFSFAFVAKPLFLQATAPVSGVNMDVLRQLNAAVTEAGPSTKPFSLDPPRSIWTELPGYSKARSYLLTAKDPPPEDAPLHVTWTAMHKRHEDTCQKLLDACRHKPVVFSLKMLAEAFGNTSSREQGVQGSKKMHAKWKKFWVEDVLAGLVLRGQAEHMYEPSTLDVLPESLSVPLAEPAVKQCAGMLHLSPSEVTFGALYVNFLAYVQSFVRSYQDYRVNVYELGKHVAAFFNPTPTWEAVQARPHQQVRITDFWANDALAAYLLSSLVKLLGGEPVYPETADMHEQSPDTSTSNVLGSPTKTLHSPAATAVSPPAGIASPASKKGSAIALEPDANAESAPPYDTHWLMGSAPDALRRLAHKLQKCQSKHGARVVTAVEKTAVSIRDQDDTTWQFLRKFAALPADVSPWDASAPPADADGFIKAAQDQPEVPGKLCWRNASAHTRSPLLKQALVKPVCTSCNQQRAVHAHTATPTT